MCTSPSHSVQSWSQTTSLLATMSLLLPCAVMVDDTNLFPSQQNVLPYWHFCLYVSWHLLPFSPSTFGAVDWFMTVNSPLGARISCAVCCVRPSGTAST
ncbi:hypothetical protein BDN67DRAFT_702434 [Paxillus ammoniavirescens]|nr:hypothetical protein BDN67DRAFT_702434 [Paxillus ammoniavirescens]